MGSSRSPSMQNLINHLHEHMHGASGWHRKFAAAVHQQLTSSHQNPTPTAQNATMLQSFEWYITNDGSHLQRLIKDIPVLKKIGITAMWLPPLCKGDAGTSDVGYGIYDLFDLYIDAEGGVSPSKADHYGQGQFDQKGTVRTKYGDIHDVEKLAETAKTNDMNLYFDAVLNHKAGADSTEDCVARKVDIHDRNRDISGDMNIRGWFRFNFPGRLPHNEPGMSDLVWRWYHFTGCDWDDMSKQSGNIYRLIGDSLSFADDVDRELGNYDYLMYADINHKHPEVRKEIFTWGDWLVKKLNLHGMRLDAIKHYSEQFLLDFLDHMSQQTTEDLFFVGEYWKDDLGTMLGYLDKMHHQFSLFDTELVYRFASASWSPDFDLRSIFDGTVVQAKPINSVTLVANHDTQKGQALEIDINGWFKPLAYALILLRISGYPCVFWGDLVGTAGGPDQGAGASCGGQLPDLILARKLYAYGEQDDYFDFATCVGWVRRGVTWDKPDGCAVVMSDAAEGYKSMYVGTMHKGERWTDVLGWNRTVAVIGDDGKATFHCSATSVSVYVREGAPGRELFGKYRPQTL